MVRPLTVAVIGTGHWGSGLVRRFVRSPDWCLRWVCDSAAERTLRVTDGPAPVRTTDRAAEVLADPAVDAVALATPAATHFGLAVGVLDAGKHVLVEKPLALSVGDGERVVGLAATRQLVLMCDHTYCFNPAVVAIRRLVRGGAIGHVRSVDSFRINHGSPQPGLDVFWDLGPHDLSIFDFVLPAGATATAVSARGVDPVGCGRFSRGHMALTLASGIRARATLDWAGATKERRMVVTGSDGTVVWDDLDPLRRVRFVARACAGERRAGPDAASASRHGGGTGWEVVAVPDEDALDSVVREFAAAIGEGRPALTDGAGALGVLRTLEAVSASAAREGRPVALRVPR